MYKNMESRVGARSDSQQKNVEGLLNVTVFILVIFGEWSLVVQNGVVWVVREEQPWRPSLIRLWWQQLRALEIRLLSVCV